MFVYVYVYYALANTRHKKEHLEHGSAVRLNLIWTWTWCIFIPFHWKSRTSVLNSWLTHESLDKMVSSLMLRGALTPFLAILLVFLRLFPNSCLGFSEMESNPKSLVWLYLFFCKIYWVDHILSDISGYTAREAAGQLMGGFASPSKCKNVVKGNKKQTHEGSFSVSPYTVALNFDLR